MSELEWVEGPVPSKADLVAEHLRAHPGRWAVIARRANVLVPWWRPMVDDNRFEVERRRSNPNDHNMFADVDVYARYIGDADRIVTEGAPVD